MILGSSKVEGVYFIITLLFICFNVSSFSHSSMVIGEILLTFTILLKVLDAANNQGVSLM